jgi:hypothetical protein
MKKLGKLNIDPSKVMKNEELVNLKGGYGGGYTTEGCFYCHIVYWGDHPGGEGWCCGQPSAQACVEAISGHYGNATINISCH